ncbi:MAG: polymerase [Curvibacter sp.]|nr:MAG: polymerase [Curvibacter sp.]
MGSVCFVERVDRHPANPTQMNVRNHLAFQPVAAVSWGLAAWAGLTVLAIVIPWLSPITWGPNHEMVQRLISASCGAILLVSWMGFGDRLHARALALTMAWGLLVAALLSAVTGVLQYFGAEGMLLYDWISASKPGQAYANLRQRNQFASLTSLGLVALLYLVTTPAAGPERRATFLKMCGVVAVVILAVGNAASSSRTGVLQWLGLLALAWVWGRPRQRSVLGWMLLAVGMYLAAAGALPQLLQASIGEMGSGALQRFQQDSGCGDRSILWSNVLELIAHKPWLGWGWGELKFAHFITPYQGERFCELLDNAHNLPLHLAVELGIPAAVLLCGGALCALVWAKPWRDTDPARQMAWAGLATIALHSLLEYPLWYGPFQLATLLCLWLLWRTRRSALATSPTSGQVRLSVLAASGVLCVVAYVGWDYWRVGQLFLPQSYRAEAYREDTMAKAQRSLLFRDMVRFARVTTTTPTLENAASLYADALQTLHYSPEPRVIGALLESARLLGQESTATEHIRRQWLANYGK